MKRYGFLLGSIMVISTALLFSNSGEALEQLATNESFKPGGKKPSDQSRLKNRDRNTDNLCLKIQQIKAEADAYISLRSQVSLGKRVAENVIDGDRSTYWHAGRRKANLVISFPEPVTISQSFWFHANVPAGRLDERGLKDYKIKTSPDGKKWKTVASIRSYLGGKKHDTFPAHEARYIKLEILQAQGFLIPVLCEWEIYEKPKPIPADELAFDPGAPLPEAPKPAILTANVFTDKMIYRFGNNARLTVNLDNRRITKGQFKVMLYLARGVQAPRELAQWNAVLKTGASRRLKYTVKNLREEYGYYVLAKVFENNQEILRSDCVFEVADNWAKISRHKTDVGFEKLVPGLPEKEITKVHVPIWRKLYTNSTHFFSQHVYFSRHYTKKAEWDTPYPGKLNNLRSAKTTKMWTRAGRESGVRILCYTEPGSLSPQLKFDVLHPNWIICGPIVYPEKTKHLYSLPHYYKNPERSFLKGKPIIGTDLHIYDVGDMYAMTDYLADDWAKAVRRFGWEGCFFDSFPWQLECSAWGHTRDGKPLNTLSPDEIGARLLSRIKKEVYRRTGVKFVSIANFGVPEGVSPWHDKNPDYDDFRRNRAVYRKTLSELGIVCLEQHPVPNVYAKDLLGRFIYPQTIEDTTRALRLIREANDVNVPVMLMALQYTRGLNRTVVDANLLYSAAYASGVLLPTGGGTPPRRLLTIPLSESPLHELEANYNKFAARYGEYLFDLNMRWLAKGEVECAAPENVWWKDLVSCRKYENGNMDIYIHLINRPDIPMTWGKVMSEPAPLADIRVTVKDQKGKRLTGIWCMSPNGNHDPQLLVPSYQNGRTAVIVPRLGYWAMLVCRYEPQY